MDKPLKTVTTFKTRYGHVTPDPYGINLMYNYEMRILPGYQLVKNDGDFSLDAIDE